MLPRTMKELRAEWLLPGRPLASGRRSSGYAGPPREPFAACETPPSLGNYQEGHWRVAGQTDRDRADNAVGGMRGAAHHDHHEVAGVGVAEGCGHRDQLLADKALSPHELPGCSAVA